MDKKLQLLRGERVLKQLEEDTYGDLEQNTQRFQPASKPRQQSANPVQVQDLKLVPAPQSGTLEVRGDINSNGNKYQSILFFQDVVFEEEDTPQNITFTAADNQEYHIQPIQLRTHNCKVRCTCLDFRWRFSVHNQSKDALHGPGPGLYINKNPNSKPRNPQRVPGLCKHLLKLAIELKNSNIVT